VEASDASVKLARRLTALDSTFLYGESANNPLHIGSLLIFEGNIPFDDLVQHVDRRLHLLPRYRQRVCGELLISPESAIGHTACIASAASDQHLAVGGTTGGKFAVQGRASGWAE